MVERTFDADAVRRFAEISGDLNPIHLDEVTARRLLFGGTVVHGVLLLLWALRGLADDRGGPLVMASLRVVFHRPVHIGNPVRLVLRRVDDGDRIDLLVGETRAVRARLTYANSQPAKADVLEGFPKPGVPRDLHESDMPKSHGRIPLVLPRSSLDELLPGMSRALSSLRLAQLLGVTRLVGMECPGLHSLLSEIDVTFSFGQGDPVLSYAVADWDERFHRVDLHVESVGLEGTVRGFLRPRPRSQASCLTLKPLVDGRFACQRALVVGGSRGLGEVAAKLLACGGADVRLTYRSGHGDAGEVVEDIRSAGGRAEAFHMDVCRAHRDLQAVFRDGWTPTHLYYFASPFAFEGSRGVFSEDVHERFLGVYVTGFEDTIRCILEATSNLRVLFPSSSAIDERVPGMEEYSAAKTAGEDLCRRLSSQYRGLSIRSVRLPRLATDQTQSLLGDEGGDPVPILAQLLMALHIEGDGV